MQNGIRNVGYVRISASRVSNRPSLNTTFASGMKRIVGGTRYARKMPSPTCFAPRKRSRSIAYAASTDAASENTVETTETSTVFHIHAGNSVLNSSVWKWTSVGLITQNGLPSRDSSSASGLTAVIAIQ